MSMMQEPWNCSPCKFGGRGELVSALMHQCKSGLGHEFQSIGRSQGIDVPNAHPGHRVSPIEETLEPGAQALRAEELHLTRYRKQAVAFATHRTLDISRVINCTSCTFFCLGFLAVNCFKLSKCTRARAVCARTCTSLSFSCSEVAEPCCASSSSVSAWSWITAASSCSIKKRLNLKGGVNTSSVSGPLAQS